jgi:ADP-ribosylglycohydrolase
MHAAASDPPAPSSPVSPAPLPVCSRSYTVDTQMSIALARSLVEQGKCDPAMASAAYAREFEPHRGYSEIQHKVLSDLRDGAVGWSFVATRHIPDGSYGNGGAMRVAPLGLAYRNAPPEVMQAAVEAALKCTHVHPAGIEGAFVQVRSPAMATCVYACVLFVPCVLHPGIAKRVCLAQFCSLTTSHA